MKKLLTITCVMVLLSISALSQNRVTIPAGTRVLIRTVEPIDTTTQKTGYRFTATLETNLTLDDVVVAPRGATVFSVEFCARSQAEETSCRSVCRLHGGSFSTLLSSRSETV